MQRADLFVLLDHVQFKKRYFENRNRLISPLGEVGFITAPVISKGRYKQAINEVLLDNSTPWPEKMVATIYHWYRRAPHFGKYYDPLAAVLQRGHGTLLSLNLALIAFFRDCLGITTPICLSSEAQAETKHGSDLILYLCGRHNAVTYLCGPSGRDYLRESDFTGQGIAIEWLDYRCPVYRQIPEGFSPGLSTLDLLFNHGPSSLEILLQGAKGSEHDHSGTE